MQSYPHITATCDWLKGQVTGQLQADSRHVRPGDGFIAWPGAANDGRAYVSQALAQGAKTCLVEHVGIEAYAQEPWFNDPRVASYPGLKGATGPIAAAFYQHPSTHLTLIAVTGTNGKTSSTWWLAHAINALATTANERCAVVGTLGIGIPPDLVANGLTTPDPVLLQAQMARLVAHGTTHCALEASSIGLQEKRLDGTHIKVALFTNLTQDHLDYHADLQDYWQAKRVLFDWPGLEHAVVNLDDPKGVELATSLAGQGLDLWTIGIESQAHLQARHIQPSLTGTQFEIVESRVGQPVQTVHLSCPFVGHFNVLNILGIIATLRALGFELIKIAKICENLPAVPGRMEMLTAPGHPTVVVDYAHTPDALDKALAALKPITVASHGKLWCIFGCGGNRDSGKRPQMARIAELGADHVVVTSDNPRHEEPLAIIQDIDQGFSSTAARQVQVDRRLAIEQTLTCASSNDVVLVAGKGHEPYQDIAGQRHAFSDLAVVRAFFADRAK